MKYFIVYILFFTSNFLFGQQDSARVSYDVSSSIEIKKFDKETIEAYKNDNDFDYSQNVEETGLVLKIWNWLKRKMLQLSEWIFGVKKAAGYLAVFLRVLPYIVVGVVILLLIKFFLKLNVKSITEGKTEKAQVILTEDEVLIKEGNIEDFIAKAISQNNYRLAVRYYYLLVLQHLQKKDLIEWEPQKTNYDYLKDLQKGNYFKSFGELTRLYDFVWYGNFEINEIEFANVEEKFKKVTIKLS